MFGGSVDTSLTSKVFSSPAIGIFSDLERDGFRLELMVDGALSIAPRSRLTPEQMRSIVENKDALQALLHTCDRGVQARRSVFASQLAHTPAPATPAFRFRTDVAYVRGICFSCGDRLSEVRFGRCWRCSLAWRLAAGVPVATHLAEALDAARIV
jgi:hypothetical protein